jgi:hypothetical protein
MAEIAVPGGSGGFGWVALVPMNTASAKEKSQAAGSKEPGALGFGKGQVVQELGYDDDVDFDLRDAIEQATGQELADEEWGDVTDGAIIWWRAEDGDLTDAVVDAISLLEDGGPVWVLTRKSGRSGHVGPAEVGEAATVAGLHATTTQSVGPDWAATLLAARGRAKNR